jgi:hypothetical protein
MSKMLSFNSLGSVGHKIEINDQRLLKNQDELYLIAMS